MKKTDAAIAIDPRERGTLVLSGSGAPEIAVSGLLGMLLPPVWGGAIVILVGGPSDPTAGPSRFSLWLIESNLRNVAEVVNDVLAVIATIGLLVLPALLPVVVLRWRQREGASVVWDDEGLTEWDGPWKRNVVPWSRMEAAHFTWQVVVGKYGHQEARDLIQIFDRASDDRVTTIWQEPPPSVPRVRRRVASSNIAQLVQALEHHHVSLTRTVDWTCIEEPERRPMRGVSLVLARVGYVGAVIGPLLAFAWPLIGISIGVIAAGLLAWRALPVLHELSVLRRRLAGAIASEMPAHDGEDGYRAAAPIPRESRAPADRIRLRAVWMEALVRGSFVVLTLFASVANGLGPSA